MNKIKLDFKIATVKRYTFQKFMEFMCLLDYRTTSWMRGYYFNLTETKDPIKWDEDTALIIYDGLGYARKKYSPFITVDKKNKFRCEHKDMINPSSTDYWIWVQRLEPYDVIPLGKIILETIQKTERERRRLKKTKGK